MYSAVPRIMPLAVFRSEPAQQLRHAEVADLGPAVAGQQDVGRLQVAVDDALLVGVVDGAGQRLEPGGGLPRRQRPAGQALGQAAARRRTPA